MNFLSQVESVGRGVGQLSVMEMVCIQLIRYFLQVTVNLNVVMGLGDVDSIKYVKITLAFDGDEEASV